MKVDPTLAVVAALHERLTTPDSEDWTLIRDGDQIHVTAYREYRRGDERHIEARYGPAPLADFKKLVEALPAKHDLGCVMLIISRDALEDSSELFGWLNHQAKAKNFSLTTMHGTTSTTEAILTMKSELERKMT